MPFLVWKTIAGKKRLVMRWNRRIDGKPKIIKEIYIGDMENLARMVERPVEGVDAYSLSFGTTAAVLSIEKDLSLKPTIDSVVGHVSNGLSPGDYALIFIMNRLSDPRSKNGIAEWMSGDFASTLYPRVTSQGYWNVMGRFSDCAMREVKDSMREKLISLGFDPSTLFVDASNFFTFMHENDMAKRGHNKAHRYDLNQISYYIGANEDYIPFYGDSYPGNVPDANTFPMIVENIPPNSTVIFGRGYNSEKNVKLLGERKYIGALIQSDHRDVLSMVKERESIAETSRVVYGKEHRIIVYHSSSLERKQVRRFMNKFRESYSRVRKIVQSGDHDALQKAQYCLESRHLQETILLPDLKINMGRLKEKIGAMGKNALFTNIQDRKAQDIVDLYRKRNRIEHCFRIISMEDLSKPEYHWTPQKIKVHMFFSHLAYLFLAVIYNRMKKIDESVSLQSVQGILSQVRLQYVISGKNVRKKIDSRNGKALAMAEKMNLISKA
jgi:transposase